MIFSSFIDKFKKLVDVNTPLICIRDFDIARVDALLAESIGHVPVEEWNPSGGVVDFRTKITRGGVFIGLPDYLNGICNDSFMEGERFIVLREIQSYLEDPQVLFTLQLICQRYLYDRHFRTVLVVVCSSVRLPESVEKYASYLDVGFPSDAEINEIIDEHLRVNHYSKEFTPEDRRDLVFSLRGMGRFDIDRVIDLAMSSNGTLSVKDKDRILEQKKVMIRKSGLVELVDAPETLDSIGGLKALKEYLMNKAKVFKDIAHAQEFGVSMPKGVFIVGMPGCGKSLCAKATANIFNAPLIKLDMGSMMGKYVGQSEENLRRAIQIAEAAAPCVLWIDEIEKAFSGIGGDNDIMTRMFGHFLSWMQDKTSSVYVVATANNADRLPPELKRKGRFDEIFCVNLPDKEERKKIFEVHLKKKKDRNCKCISGALSAFNLEELAQKTSGFNGADIESVVVEAIENNFLLDKQPPIDISILLKTAENTLSISRSCKKQIDDMKKIFAESSFRDANTGKLTTAK